MLPHLNGRNALAFAMLIVSGVAYQNCDGYALEQSALSPVVAAALTAASAAAPAPAAYYTCTRNLYVAGSGSDSNDGKTASSAFKTLQHAASAAVRAGDCINVAPGTYAEAVNAYRGGSADSLTGYLVFRSSQPLAAKIVGPAGSEHALNVGANYVIVDGFDIQAALGAGVHSSSAHHVKVVNSRIHGCGSSGIALAWGDYYQVEGNTAFANAGLDPAQTSGISIWEPRAISDAADGFHILVRGNTSYGNIEGNIASIAGEHTDGNGIIIDDFENTQAANGAPYPYATLVENNLVYKNGGRGIHVGLSQNVLVRNNTAYGNNRDLQNPGSWRGELENAQSSNVLWIDNVAYADPSIDARNVAIGDNGLNGITNPGVRWLNCLTFNGVTGAPALNIDGGSTSHVLASDGNLLGVDPFFVDLASGNFRLKLNSAGVGAASDVNFAPYDILRQPRSVPAAMGAYAD